jgi:hypothetical protein
MATVVVKFITEVRKFPAGSKPGLFRASLSNSSGTAFLEGDFSEFTFDGVAAGSYVVTAQRLDEAGVPLVTVQKDLTVVDAEVDIMVPVDFTATVTP